MEDGQVGELRRVRRDEGCHLWVRWQWTRDVRLAEVGDLTSTATNIEEDSRDVMDAADQRLDAARCVARLFVRTLMRSIERRIAVWLESEFAWFAGRSRRRACAVDVELVLRSSQESRLPDATVRGPRC